MTIFDPELGRAIPLPPAVEATREGEGAFAPASSRRRRSILRMVAADVIALVVAGFAGLLLLSALSSNPQSGVGHLGPSFAFNVAIVPVFLAVFSLYGLYRGTTRRISPALFSDLKDIVHALMISGFLYAIVGYVADRAFGFDELSVGKITAMCLVAALTVPAARAAGRQIAARSADATVPIIVVGTGIMAKTIATHLRAHANVRFVGYVDDHPLDGDHVLGSLDDLPDLCRHYRVARVVVCFSRTHPERTIEMLKSLAGQVAVSIVPRYYELITIRSHVEDLSGLPVVDIAPASLSAGARFAKRSFDVVVASAALLVISPLLAVCAVLIKLTSPGPVFFRQERTGRGARPFWMLKFRTMYDGAESARDALTHLNEVDGPLFKVRTDPRVTTIGRFLRRTSLDELPQLINVWRGDMSLVGPRPFIVSESAAIEGWARKRFEARPGMTGLWQVSGRNELSYLELCRLDYLYVASWSFWWDLRILWQTPATVIHGRGAS